MASLRELQRAFAAALRAAADERQEIHAVRPAANLGIYRNNVDWQFRNALALSFPVLRRRVGDDYFRQLASVYRRPFPSRSGDLHWVGRDFADFLADHLAGGDYAWLADLARLEWARELAAVAETRPPLGVEVLAGIPADQLEHLVFELQPSLGLGISGYPVVSVWEANQVENAPPVDQSIGCEAYMVLSRDDSVKIRRLAPGLIACFSALKERATLATAMSTAGLDEAGLLEALRTLFAEQMVCRVHSEKR